MSRDKGIYRSGLLVISLIIIGKGISFGRDIFISYFYGATLYSDAYFAANVIPSILFGALISSVLVYFTPIYADNFVNKGEQIANIFANNTLNILMLAAIALSITAVIFADSLIYISAPGFDAARHNLAVRLCRILSLSFVFNSISLTYAAISNYNRSFVTPQLIPIVSGICVIWGMVLFNGTIGIFSVAISVVFATVIQVIIQHFSVKKFFTYNFHVDFNDPKLKKMIILTLPVFLGMFVDQLNLFVDSILCSSLTQGSLSAMNYAQRLLFTINGVFATGIITVLYPHFADFAAKKNYKQLIAYLNRTLKILTLILVPIVLVIIFEKNNIIKLVFYRGAFDDTALSLTSNVFVYYSLGLLFLGFREIYTRVFYVYNDSKTPFIIGLIAALINITLNFILVKPMGVAGLAFATSISCLISSIMFHLLLRKKRRENKSAREKNCDFFLLKIILASASVVFFRIVLYYFDIKTDCVWVLIINTLIMLLIFIIVLLFVKEENSTRIKNKVFFIIKSYVQG